MCWNSSLLVHDKTLPAQFGISGARFGTSAESRPRPPRPIPTKGEEERIPTRWARILSHKRTCRHTHTGTLPHLASYMGPSDSGGGGSGCAASWFSTSWPQAISDNIQLTLLTHYCNHGKSQTRPATSLPDMGNPSARPASAAANHLGRELENA